MRWQLTIPGTLPTLSQFISSENDLQVEELIERTISHVSKYIEPKHPRLSGHVTMTVYFIRPNTRTNKSDVGALAMVCIEEALKRCGVIRSTDWHSISPVAQYGVDTENPRTVVIVNKKED